MYRHPASRAISFTVHMLCNKRCKDETKRDKQRLSSQGGAACGPGSNLWETKRELPIMLRGQRFLLIRHLVLHDGNLYWPFCFDIFKQQSWQHDVASTSIEAGFSSEIYGHWTWTWTQHGVYWNKDGNLRSMYIEYCTRTCIVFALELALKE